MSSISLLFIHFLLLLLLFTLFLSCFFLFAFMFQRGQLFHNPFLEKNLLPIRFSVSSLEFRLFSRRFQQIRFRSFQPFLGGYSYKYTNSRKLCF